MMMQLLTLCTMLAAATAFTAQPWGVATRSVAAPTTARFMFSADDDNSAPLKLSSDATAVDTLKAPEAGAAPKSVVRNLAAGGEEREVKWVDPAMRANTNPFEMSWWAYPLFGLPPVIRKFFISRTEKSQRTSLQTSGTLLTCPFPNNNPRLQFLMMRFTFCPRKDRWHSSAPFKPTAIYIV
jgi:hypothetical protein